MNDEFTVDDLREIILAIEQVADQYGDDEDYQKIVRSYDVIIERAKLQLIRKAKSEKS